MSDELQKIAWASTSGGASGGQAREPVLWEDGLLLRILGHDGVTAFDFPTLDLLGDLDGAASIGADDSGFSVVGGSTVQAVLASIDAALDGLAGSGFLLADGSTPYAGSQSLAGFNLTDVGSVEFSDGQELTSNTHSILAEADVISHGNDGFDAIGDKARFAVVETDTDKGLAGMMVEYGYGLALSVFSFGATGGRMGDDSVDSILIHEKDGPFDGGEVGILAEPVADIALTAGGPISAAGRIFAKGDLPAIPQVGACLGYASDLAKLFGWNGAAVTPLMVSGVHNLNPLDLYSGASEWVDFSGSLALAGLGSLTISVAKYRMIGKSCFIQLLLKGTNSASGITFDLPVEVTGMHYGSETAVVGPAWVFIAGNGYGGWLSVNSVSGSKRCIVHATSAGDAFPGSGVVQISANFVVRADAIPT